MYISNSRHTLENSLKVNIAKGGCQFHTQSKNFGDGQQVGQRRLITAMHTGQMRSYDRPKMIFTIKNIGFQEFEVFLRNKKLLCAILAGKQLK